MQGRPTRVNCNALVRTDSRLPLEGIEGGRYGSFQSVENALWDHQGPSLVLALSPRPASAISCSVWVVGRGKSRARAGTVVVLMSMRKFWQRDGGEGGTEWRWRASERLGPCAALLLRRMHWRGPGPAQSAAAARPSGRRSSPRPNAPFDGTGGGKWETASLAAPPGHCPPHAHSPPVSHPLLLVSGAPFSRQTPCCLAAWLPLPPQTRGRRESSDGGPRRGAEEGEERRESSGPLLHHQCPPFAAAAQ